MQSKEIEKLEEVFEKYFNETMMVSLSGEEYTYGQVWSNALIISDDWKEKGVRQGDHVAFLLSNHLSLLVSYISCAIGGFVAIPLNPNLDDHLINKFIKLSQPTLIIKENFKLSKKRVFKKDYKIRIRSTNNSMFIILHTSGTTGEPKGICHSLESIIGSAMSYSMLSSMNEKTIMYNTLPMYYMAGLLNTFFAPIITGGKMIEGEQFSLSTQFTFWTTVVKSKANFICITPTLALSLCYLAKDIIIAKKNVENLISIQSTAGVLHQGVRNKFYEIFGKPLQDCYGLTELGGPLTLQTPKDAIDEHCSGNIIPTLEYTFLNDSSDGDTLLLKSPYMMKGYITEDGLDVPFDECGYFNTGDQCIVFDNKLKVTGRIKDIIIRGAENIAIIENEISIIDVVKDVAVIGVDHEFWGEIVVVCVILNDDCQLDEFDKIISSFESKPQKLDKWVVFNKFPRTAYGKVKKGEMRQHVINNNFEYIKAFL